VLIWMAAAGMVSSAVAEESSSGTSWLRTCTKAAPANAPCIGYIKAMHDMNEMLTEVFQRPLWCAPNSATVGNLRHVIVSDLAGAQPSRLDQPFAGLATLALKARFPCKGSATSDPSTAP
jgi:hypothetical protein